MAEAHAGIAAFSVRRQTGFTAIAVACFILLYLPIVTLVVYSFNAGDLDRDLGGLFAALVPVGLAERRRCSDAALRSLVIASCRGGDRDHRRDHGGAGHDAHRATIRGLTFVYALINQPLMVPEIVTGVALLIFFCA